MLGDLRHIDAVEDEVADGALVPLVVAAYAVLIDERAVSRSGGGNDLRALLRTRGVQSVEPRGGERRDRSEPDDTRTPHELSQSEDRRRVRPQKTASDYALGNLGG